MPQNNMKFATSHYMPPFSSTQNCNNLFNLNFPSLDIASELKKRKNLKKKWMEKKEGENFCFLFYYFLGMSKIE